MPTTATINRFASWPLLWLALSFCVGIALSRVVAIPLTVAVATTILLGITAFFSRKHIAATVVASAAFATLGVVCDLAERTNISTDRLKGFYENGTLHSGNPVEVEGSVVGYPETSPDGLFITLAANRILYRDKETKVSGNVRLFLPIEHDSAKAEVNELAIAYGTRIRVLARLEREDRFLNPGVARRTELLDRKGVDATGVIKSPLLIERLGRDPVFIPLAFIYELRANLIESFRQTFQPRTAGILIASTFGNKHFLDRETADVFREGGTFHVLVISGLHITFIGGLILLMVQFFTRNRHVQAAVALSFLWLYGVAVGGEAPVIRACVMFTILMIGYASYRTANLLNSLGACVLALLVWRPSDLFDASFQLTILSVAGIIGLGLPLLTKLKQIGEWMPSAAEPFPPNVPNWLRRFCETIYWREAAWEIEGKRHIWSAQIFKTPLLTKIDQLGLRRILIYIFDGFVISIAVQIFLLPLLVYYFHRISFASILLNLWVGPLLAVESLSSIVAVAVSPVSSFLAIPFVTLTEILNWLLIWIPATITNTAFASIRIPIYSGELKAIYFVYFLPVLVLAFCVIRWNPFSLLRTQKKIPIITATAAALLAGIIIFHPFSTPRPDGRLHVEFLDVGQGDAAFITFPSGRTMLVDAGGRMNYGDEDATFEPDVPRIGEAVVSEFLWEKGISQIDYIVATHADTDHIQGLADVANNFSIGRAYFGRLEVDDTDLNELVNVLDRFGVPKETVSAGDAFSIDNVKIEVLSPFPDTQLSANNDSVVLRVIFGDVSFLLTGDIEREAEDLIVRSGFDLRSTVVKVPHHGSRSSSTQPFVNSVTAKYAVISVGRQSVFGHPHAEVVERWKAIGTNLIKTGEKGTITFSTDGKNLELSLFLSEITNR